MTVSAKSMHMSRCGPILVIIPIERDANHDPQGTTNDNRF